MEGDELRARRERLNLTQAELAALLGVQPNTIARWERGESPITAHGAIALALEAIDQERRRGVREAR